MSNRVPRVAFVAHAFLRAVSPFVATSSPVACSSDLPFEIRGLATSSVVTFQKPETLESFQ